MEKILNIFLKIRVLINEDSNAGQLPFYSKRIENGMILKEDKVIFKISQINHKSYFILKIKNATRII